MTGTVILYFPVSVCGSIAVTVSPEAAKLAINPRCIFAKGCPDLLGGAPEPLDCFLAFVGLGYFGSELIVDLTELVFAHFGGRVRLLHVLR